MGPDPDRMFTHSERDSLITAGSSGLCDLRDFHYGLKDRSRQLHAGQAGGLPGAARIP